MNVAAYVRLSTEDQNLARQLEATNDYAQSTLDVAPVNIETYRDKSTGTNTERSGYYDLMDAVEGGDHDVVVVKSISRVARSIRDLEATAVPLLTQVVRKNLGSSSFADQSFDGRPPTRIDSS